MNDKLITVTQAELEQIVSEAVQKERQLLFRAHMEDYFLLPICKKRTYKGRTQIIMSEKAWETHLEQLSQVFGDLDMARENIAQMEPIYHEYFNQYQQNHANKDILDDYINMTALQCNVDELERVRDRIEDMYYKRLDEDELER